MSNPLEFTTYFDVTYKEINGFLSHGAATMIKALLLAQKMANIQGSLVEIGVFYGKVFLGLALARGDNEHLTGIDIFENNGQDFSHKFLENLKKYQLSSPNIHIHKGDSNGIDFISWRNLLRQPARFVHVDGDHTYKSALHDLTLATSFLARGAVVVIDDVLHPWFPDVTRATFDFFSTAPQIVPIALVDNRGSLMNGGAKLIAVDRLHADAFKQLIYRNFRDHVKFDASFCDHVIAILDFESNYVVPRKSR